MKSKKIDKETCARILNAALGAVDATMAQVRLFGKHATKERVGASILESAEPGKFIIIGPTADVDYWLRLAELDPDA